MKLRKQKFTLLTFLCVYVFVTYVHCVPNTKTGCWHARKVIFKGNDCVSKFSTYIHASENEGCTFVAHNFKGYDGAFILNEFASVGVPVDTILNGNKIMSITSKHKLKKNAKGERKLSKFRFIDSLNFLPMALAKFPDTFGLIERKKGFFPYLFNTTENENFVGCWPDKEFYNPDEMPVKKRKKFMIWYENQKHKVYNHQRELKDYCLSDVIILKEGCITFIESFKEQFIEDPMFNSLTIASACMRVFKCNYLTPETIAIVPPSGRGGKRAQSLKARKWLAWIQKEEHIQLQSCDSPEGEAKVTVNENTYYYVDGLYEPMKIIYEFYGCAYHGCKKCYTNRQTLTPFGGTTLEEAFDRTSQREDELRELGYEIRRIWECEWDDLVKEDETLNAFLECNKVIAPLNPRDAFFGGRTNATKLYYKCKEGEKMHYLDFCSLYPYINKYGSYPTGHPTYLSNPSKEEFDNCYGLVSCVMIPPRNLFHPVLPARIRGKLMFVLCSACAVHEVSECTHSDDERALHGTWVHLELQKAIEKGYTLQAVHEIWHFDTHVQDGDDIFGLFTEYVNNMLKMKQESSGYPRNCKSEEEKVEYIRDYYQEEGVQLDPNNICKNPGKRALAKLMLNSFWGKFGQRDQFSQSSMVYTASQFFDLLTDQSKEVANVNFLSPQTALMTFKDKDEWVTGGGKTNVFIAAFTTAQARLHLYNILDQLGNLAVYQDTDSVIYIEKPGDPPDLVETGNYLGDLTDELAGYGEGAYISEFVSGGPKNYAYKVQCPDGKVEEVVKAKGITINYSSSQIVNFNTLHTQVNALVDGKAPEAFSVSVSYNHKIGRDYL